MISRRAALTAQTITEKQMDQPKTHEPLVITRDIFYELSRTRMNRMTDLKHDYGRVTAPEAHWIDCKQRMPHEGEPVLVWMPESLWLQPGFEVAVRDDSSWSSRDGSWAVPLDRVVCWAEMVLPKLP